MRISKPKSSKLAVVNEAGCKHQNHRQPQKYIQFPNRANAARGYSGAGRGYSGEEASTGSSSSMHKTPLL